MTQALDIEAVNTKAKQIAEETGVFPDGWIVAREFARGMREADIRSVDLVDQLVVAQRELREATIRIGWLEQKIASVV